MKHLAPACFRAFACAGGDCPDSCCRAGWEIVPDGETLNLYQKLPGAVGERIRAGIVPAVVAADPGGHNPCEGALRAMAAEVRGHYGNAEPLLRQDQSRVCVLLDADGFCCVQKSFGHGALCRVCRDYPRFRRDFGGLTEHGLSLSCPTAYALATSAPLIWEEWEDDALPLPNDLDPAAYLRLRKGRELALALLGREELPLWQRVALVHRLAAAMQEAPERLVRHDYAIRMRRWSTAPAARSLRPSSAPMQARSAPGPRWGPAGSAGELCPEAKAMPLGGFALGRLPPRGKPLAALARRFLALEILSPVWKDALERFRDAADQAGGQWPPLQGAGDEACARWLACSLYKYWLDALDDGNLLGRVERSLDMLLLGIAMDRALPGEGPFLRRISREIEHCEENLEKLLAFHSRPRV